jgi:hypothetical protein
MLAHAFLTVQRARHLADTTELPCSNAPQENADTAPPTPAAPPLMPSDSPRTVGPMIRLTVTVVAGFLAHTGLAVHHDDTEILRQHHWRTEHQTATTISHY